ncbi:5-formyltetrahydrofolate cyclo-ligase [Crocinitomix algicola]|uniref:5-formyltetrahydrofolate cyclo-ligase n=1 Tax=Crocinitomix algicola TaxID=1740263 RepID=UPI000834D85D|nr:5-formyltetrahydrofolate cyclo-ligase [Crocinitomix algicola]
MDIVKAKSLLRKEMQTQRDHLNHNEKSSYDQKICEALIKLVENRECKVVHVYIPMGSEINIIPFIQYLLNNNIKVIAPKTLAKPILENRVLSSLNDLEKGVFGTVHPKNSTPYTGSIDLVVIPGLAIDKNAYRLGYGGGYYDTFLAKYPNAFKVGIYYPFQCVEQVPTEPHDIPLDVVVIHD